MSCMNPGKTSIFEVNFCFGENRGLNVQEWPTEKQQNEAKGKCIFIFFSNVTGELSSPNQKLNIQY